FLASFKIWNEATVGGNLCLALPAGPMTSLTASLDGICTIWNPHGEVIRVPASRFVVGHGRNVLRDGALLRSVTLPERALRSRTAFRQVSRSRLGRSAAVVTGRRDPDSGETVITVTASVTRPVQLRFPHGVPSAPELTVAIDEAAPPYFDDPHGTSAWRAHLTPLLAEQARAELESGRP
ncbi:MAG: FAD binding domain-containing protein, partial [Solirubrobacterales bacterium]|nr:FAD binding domain-containing protein [Solirubrobacterales bacterium]